MTADKKVFPKQILVRTDKWCDTISPELNLAAIPRQISLVGDSLKPGEVVAIYELMEIKVAETTLKEPL